MFKGATGLYKPVVGTGASFWTKISLFHTRDRFFSELRNNYK